MTIIFHGMVQTQKNYRWLKAFSGVKGTLKNEGHFQAEKLKIYYIFMTSLLDEDHLMIFANQQLCLWFTRVTQTKTVSTSKHT